MPNRKIEFSRGDVIAKKYEVEELLDESPLGLTYRVRHINSGKLVRLVMLQPALVGAEQKDQLIASFRAAKELSHPHLTKVGELSDHEGVAYYTMEDFDGSTLRDLLQEYKVGGRQFDVKEAAQITLQILEALTAVHDAGLVLRGLRPEYVLVRVKYTGPRQKTFVAQVKLLHVGFWDLVPTGVIAEDEFTRGDAQYIAPELKSFEPVATARADIYSTGVMLYEMITGTAPVGTFQQPTTVRPDLPAHIDQVVELAISNAPEDRYQSARDFVTDIQRIFQNTATDDDAAKKPLVSPVVWAMSLVVVAAIGVILFQMRPDPQENNRALDAEIRNHVRQAFTMPPAEEFHAVLEGQENMIYVPAGPFIHGRMHSEPDALLSEDLAKVEILNGFLIDAFEYPNKKNARPVQNVDFAEAERLCAEQGKRLCTALEWEKACKGPGNHVYAYGDDYSTEPCGEALKDPRYLAGAMPQCHSKWPGPGPFDMSGNLREWTATAVAGKDNRILVKGGLRSNPQRGTRCAFTTDESTSFKDGSMSFRCCLDVEAAASAAAGDEAEG